MLVHDNPILASACEKKDNVLLASPRDECVSSSYSTDDFKKQRGCALSLPPPETNKSDDDDDDDDDDNVYATGPQ